MLTDINLIFRTAEFQREKSLNGVGDSKRLANVKKEFIFLLYQCL